MLYGSDLLGVWKPDANSQSLPPTSYAYFYNRKIGNKQYSIKDHLGNVRVTFADKKIPANGQLLDFYTETQSVSTYYPFGWEIEPLSWAFESFKFGFNGKIKDEQIAGGALDYGARIYSSKIGRWMSTDPLFMKYPNLSSYNYVANNPLKFIDPDGKKVVLYNKEDQARVLKYLDDQFGSGIFSFNKNGVLKMNNKTLKNAMPNFNQEQIDMAKGFKDLIKGEKLVEVKMYENSDINFSRNPTLEKTVWNPVTGLEEKVKYKKYGEGNKGVVIAKLEQGAITMYVEDDNKAFILINKSLIDLESFNAKDGGMTTPCGSCLFIHEALDHGLDYVKDGTLDPEWKKTQQDMVIYHNKALKNKGSKERIRHYD